MHTQTFLPHRHTIGHTYTQTADIWDLSMVDSMPPLIRQSPHELPISASLPWGISTLHWTSAMQPAATSVSQVTGLNRFKLDSCAPHAGTYTSYKHAFASTQILFHAHKTALQACGTMQDDSETSAGSLEFDMLECCFTASHKRTV